MASKIGQCNNLVGCTLAYTKQPITIAENAEFRCPECGQPLVEASGGKSKAGGKSPVPLIVGALAGVLLLAGAAFFFFQSKPANPTANPEPKPAAQNEAESTPPPPPPSEAKPVAETSPAPPVPPPLPEAAVPEPAPIPPAAAPPAMAQASPPPPIPPAPALAKPPEPLSTPAKIEASAAVSTPPSASVVESKEETAQVKKQVLARIDLMPNLSKTNRTRLYDAVDRARGMFKLAVVPFESGRTNPNPQASAQLLERMRSSQVLQVLSDPTVVLVSLGYADAKGDDRKNLQISEDRAESLLKVLRDQGKTMNVMHAVGMGSSELFGRQQLEKNRVAEIWAVLP